MLCVVGFLMVASACGATTWPGGIQARLLWSAEDGVRVLDTVPEGPAEQAGLRAGDRLVAIDGVPVDALNAQQVHERLGGEVGSSVELTIDRNGVWQTLNIMRAPYQSGGAGSP